MTFTGCELVLATGKVPCTTPGTPPETIVTAPLPAVLGYITHTPTKSVVGLQIGNGELVFAEFDCINKVTCGGRSSAKSRRSTNS